MCCFVFFPSLAVGFLGLLLLSRLLFLHLHLFLHLSSRPHLLPNRSTPILHNFLHSHCCTSSLVLQVCLWHSSHSLSLPAENWTRFIETHPHVHGVHSVVHVKLGDCADFYSFGCVKFLSSSTTTFDLLHSSLSTPSTDLNGMVFSPKSLILSPFSATNLFVLFQRFQTQATWYPVPVPSNCGDISASMTYPATPVSIVGLMFAQLSSTSMTYRGGAPGLWRETWYRATSKVLKSVDALNSHRDSLTLV